MLNLLGILVTQDIFICSNTEDHRLRASPPPVKVQYPLLAPSQDLYPLVGALLEMDKQQRLEAL